MFADAAIYGIALFVVGQNLDAQLKAAHLSGWFQFGLAIIVLIVVLRRFIYGSEPVSILMILIGGLALAATTRNGSISPWRWRRRRTGAR
ncbi:hypothetical protein ACTXQV_64315, partial [Klebsiella pneumoniae]